MSSRIFLEPEKKSSVVFSPTFGKKLSDRTSAPKSAHSGHDVINPRFGHNFGDVRVKSSQSFKQSFPLALSGPTYCPFGGACHTCPVHVQTKLKPNQPADKHEREADLVADRVTRMLEPKAAQKKTDSGPEQRSRGNLQRRAASQTEPVTVPPIVHEVLRSPGKPLGHGTRASMESRFGHDFSRVRIHTDAKSAESARAVNALAYTVGSDMVFGSGRYCLQTAPGKNLLAHELTHVIQQQAAPSIRSSAHPQSCQIRQSSQPHELTWYTNQSRVGNFLHPPHPLKMQVSNSIEEQIQRTPEDETVPALPTVMSFEQRWAQFDQLRQSDPARALNMVPSLISQMDHNEARRYGLALAFWLMDRGRWDLAERALAKVENGFYLEWVCDTLLRDEIRGDSRPEQLINRAQIEARADRHTQAFRLFGVAFRLVQMLLHARSEARVQELERVEEGIRGQGERSVIMAQAATYGILRLFFETPMERLYGYMRDILGFYPREERTLLLAGDQERARHMSGLGLLLRRSLEEEYRLGEMHATTMESVAAYDRFGRRGYQLQGTPAEVVTPLPGTRTPEELGLFPPFHSPFAESPRRPDVEDIISGRAEQMARMPPEIGLLEVIAGQEELVTRLYQYPEIRRAFGARGVDMNNMEQRLQVWQIMYRIYQAEDTQGLGVLYRLMHLMGKYLRVYTRHTQYNIRDYGVSYLSSEFPTDMTGRAMRDCGVYALTIAYEVYRTARAAHPRLRLDFRLYSMPEHVTLVIFDLDQDRHYVVNNEQISPGRRGGPNSQEVMRDVARTYSATFGRAFSVTPMQTVTLGTTGMTTAAFRRQAWERYRATTLWGLREEPPGGPGDTRTASERRRATYRRYYTDLLYFDHHAALLQRVLDALSRQQASGTPTNPREHLQNHIEPLSEIGRRLALIFFRYSPYTPPQEAIQVAEADPARVRAVLGRGWTPRRLTQALGARRYLYVNQPGAETSAHPLTRLARVLLRFQNLDGVLTPQQDALIDFVRAVPELRPDLERYESAGYPPQF